MRRERAGLFRRGDATKLLDASESSGSNRSVNAVQCEVLGQHADASVVDRASQPTACRGFRVRAGTLCNRSVIKVHMRV